MQMRRVDIVGIRAEVIWMVVQMVDLFDSRPGVRRPAGIGEFAAQLRSQLTLKTIKERSRIERGKCVACDALVIFQNDGQLGFELQIRADIDASQRIRIVLVKRFTILAVVAGLQADVEGGGFIAGSDSHVASLALPC